MKKLFRPVLPVKACILFLALYVGAGYFDRATGETKGDLVAEEAVSSGQFPYLHLFQLKARIATESQNAATARTELERFNQQFPMQAGENFAVTQTRTQLTNNVVALGQNCRNSVDLYNKDASSYRRSRYLNRVLAASIDPAVCDNPSLLK